METGTEGTYEDTHDDRTAGNAQFHGDAHAWESKGNGPQCQSENDTDENGSQIRLVQTLYGIAQKSLHMVHGLMIAHHVQTVAILQSQIGSGQQFHVAAGYSAHIHLV